ncbi:MAG: GNAT family N-acetyltransferase [Gemmatimonadales bacterium]|nr:GNAT family N-acetyltransferase [Gemmatimonadales bacterium]
MPRSLRLSLRDGTPVLIRPVVPKDKALLKEGLIRLSEHYRYRRFMTPVPDVTEEQLRYLTEIDYRDHMAWAAFDLSRSEELGVGVARYIRHEPDRTKAEVAVPVVDSHLQRGIGTLLLSVLSRSAAENAIRTFVAYVLAANTRTLAIFRDLGATVEPGDGGVMRVEVPAPRRNT